MPAFTVSAVNTGTEQLTATGHGLLTGDRFRLRNIGGALPAATPALNPVTTYFAIRVDNDNIKVAVSSSDALANVAVNITGAGTGTHLIEYGLPYCEPRVAAVGTQIKSADDNATWASLVALHALLTDQAQSTWPGVSLVGPRWLLGSDAVQDTTGTLVLADVTWQSVTSGGEQFLTFTVPLPAGTRITAITVYGVEGNAGGEVYRAFFEELSTGGSPSQISTTKTSGTTGGGSSIGWTTADTDFTPNGYTMTDLPHRIRVGIAQTSGAAEVRVSAIKIVLG